MLYRIFSVSVVIMAMVAVAACGDRGGESTASDDWAQELVPPIRNATFSLSESHLPEAPREYRDGHSPEPGGERKFPAGICSDLEDFDAV